MRRYIVTKTPYFTTSTGTHGYADEPVKPRIGDIFVTQETAVPDGHGDVMGYIVRGDEEHGYVYISNTCLTPEDPALAEPATEQISTRAIERTLMHIGMSEADVEHILGVARLVDKG